MSQKHISVYLHLIWATWDREEWISTDLERRIYRMIVSAVYQLGCRTLVINGMPDHIHLLVQFKTTLTIAQLVKKAKGSSSRLINKLSLIDEHFKWSTGYGAFSVSRWDTDRIVKYIQNQKEHHRKNNIIVDLEELPYMTET